MRKTSAVTSSDTKGIQRGWTGRDQLDGPASDLVTGVAKKLQLIFTKR